MGRRWFELLMDDHSTTEKVIDAVDRVLHASDAPPADVVRGVVDYFVEYADGTHNKKEEEHLFPLLERRGVPRGGGPLAVMLAEHEQSRRLLSRVRAAAEAYLAGDSAAAPGLRDAFREYSSLLKSHYWKENDILYPMAMRVLDGADEAAIVRGIGAVEARQGADTHQRYAVLAARLIEAGEIKDLSYGLDRAVLAAMLNTLPVEISFVDADDTVRYFSHENRDKIFPRSRGAIGMKVQECHPEKSLHLVNRIVADFKAGRRDAAEFWIDFRDMKVHIRYFAVRGPGGAYLGTMEVVQDVSPIRALQGERRLLAEA
ncbi:MAG: hypothetical protein A2X51_00890 [Candidatus Rokubacteria bacterium GWC2_70_24]|nr:MAG: hypothetical protein A2X53_13015 [Candidatus Rokubacteria bacterium GWA2_70_23]OGK90032.1 MAG: hypothetical protein A2X50_00610 [Candidatus Rokubacteria bacterium GWF2_70_14]OGK93085.1 MAG: hypothetical protein A2X51_00890 [Candidatus Rokubacteria bacterium GWC2_70_24]